MNRLSSLFDRHLVVTDGGWATEFQKRGLALGTPSESWNLTHPDQVEAVARAYVEAGSQVILTNTFRANPLAWGSAAETERIKRINRRGVEISKKAAGTVARVFASIGPTGRDLPGGAIDEQSVLEAFQLQANALAEAGADALVLETFSDVNEACLAVQAAQPAGLPIVVSFSFHRGPERDQTITGATPEAAAGAMAELGVDAIGANCGAGPEFFPGLCRRLKQASGLPVWVKPSAGMPVLQGGKAIYTMKPEAFAGFVPALVEAGASFVGGCCGTSPDFIRAVVKKASGCECS